MTHPITDLNYLHGQPKCHGRIKLEPSHFQVYERLNFTPTGEGEHFLVRIRKIGENTKYVANELAKACGVPSRDVSWAGLKDRHAITEQWFSVHLPGKPDPDLSAFVATHEGIDAIVATDRHDKKLRPGDLIGNQFQLTLSELDDIDDALSRLSLIKKEGVPNYFGEQRFGKNAGNLESARAWGQDKFRVRDKSKRSFYLSAARSHLFNQVLSARIAIDRCQKVWLGDILLLDDGSAHLVEDLSLAKQWIESGHGSISGPLTCDNALPTRDVAQIFEQSILDDEPDLLKVIRGNRMRHDSRNLCLQPQQMSWQLEENNITVQFFLPAGAFATAVIREVIQDNNHGEQNAYFDQ